VFYKDIYPISHGIFVGMVNSTALASYAHNFTELGN